jgi:acetyltransferase-like isoleucine patch superfamily enzyme
MPHFQRGKQLKYFYNGNFLYGLVYTFWRGFNFLGRLIVTWFYRLTMPNLGEGTKFDTGVYIDNPRNIEIGQKCKIGENVYFHSEDPHSKLIIGDAVQVSNGVVIDYTGGVTIKNNVLISANVQILTHDHGIDPHSKPISKQLLIESDVWIGLNSLILHNVRVIGKGVIIGAGSIVTKPVDAMFLIAGNPAKVIRKI